jgi:hypothetical protein
MEGRIGDAPLNGCQTGQQTAAKRRERSEHAVPVDARDRVTVDLRGLGLAAKEQAAARKLTLAAFARMAIVEKLKPTTDQTETPDVDCSDHGPSVKLTLRLPMREASWLVRYARAAGLSYGTFLASVIDGAPCPGSLAEALRSLTESTNQMAGLSRDLNVLTRLLAGAKFEETRKYRQQLSVLLDEVRRHMRLTSALASEVRHAVRFKAPDRVGLDPESGT